jgi:Alginate lyase
MQFCAKSDKATRKKSLQPLGKRIKLLRPDQQAARWYTLPADKDGRPHTEQSFAGGNFENQFIFGGKIMSRSKATRMLVCAVTIAACVLAPIAFAVIGTGWNPAPLSFKVQWPFNVPESSRFTLTNGVYHLLVFSNDKPFAPGNTTKPRTEMRFDDYTTGAHQFEADMMVPAGTGGTSIMQIHTGNAQSPKFGATQLMLFFETSAGGSLHFYSGQQLAGNLYNKWFHLNVIHDTKTGLITVYINGTLVFSKHDNRAGDYYMKGGVYAQNGETKKMEVFIKNLKLWSK